MDWWAMRIILSMWQSAQYGFGMYWHRHYVHHDCGHRPTPQPCPASGSPHWIGWIQLFLSEWVLHSSAQRSFVSFFPVGYCPLRVKNYRLPVSGPEKGASVRGLLCAVYTMDSGDSLHSSTAWVHSHSGECWERRGQDRNKHTANIKLSLSWQIPS